MRMFVHALKSHGCNLKHIQMEIREGNEMQEATTQSSLKAKHVA